MFQMLYKLKTAKVFERPRSKEDKPSTELVEEDPFAIQTLSWCPESRILCVAGVSAHVLVYRFSKQEVTTEEVQVSNSVLRRFLGGRDLCFCVCVCVSVCVCRHFYTFKPVGSRLGKPGNFTVLPRW